MTKDERAILIEKLIRMVWDSLESHLVYTHTKHPDGKEHHVTCVKEYAEMIRLLSELY